MLKNLFHKINFAEFTELQKNSVQNILSSKDLYFAINDSSKEIKLFKNSLVKIGSVSLKDNSTRINLYIQKKSKLRAILMIGDNKEFFIVSDRWLDVL
tara:strand:+ start:14 stop:307 length:294 start_codon:yes stop_codon:yes gene_type:complete